MNNLTTRKIVLGLLMALVLAFGVQGVAEAVKRPGDQEDLNPDYSIQRWRNCYYHYYSRLLDDDDRRETVSISRSSGITFTGDFLGLQGEI